MAERFELQDEFTEDGFLYFYVYQKIDPETSRRYGWFMSIDPEEEFYQYFDGDLSNYEVTNPTIVTASDGLRYERKTWIDTTITKEMCDAENDRLFGGWLETVKEMVSKGVITEEHASQLQCNITHRPL